MPLSIISAMPTVVTVPRLEPNAPLTVFDAARFNLPDLITPARRPVAAVWLQGDADRWAGPGHSRPKVVRGDPRISGAGAGHRPLVEAYNARFEGVEAFHSIHLENAASYVFSQAQWAATNPTAVGTGDAPFMPYFKKHRDETGASRLNGAAKA